MSRRERIVDVFHELSRLYEPHGLLEAEIHELHDIHAFYRFAADPERVVHLQGYPGLSSDEYLWIWGREMGYQRMREIRARGEASIGNEHDAVTRLFPNFESGLPVPWSAAILQIMLGLNDYPVDG